MSSGTKVPYIASQNHMRQSQSSNKHSVRFQDPVRVGTVRNSTYGAQSTYIQPVNQGVKIVSY